MVKREKRSLKFLFLNKKSEPKRCKRKGIHRNVLWFNMAGSYVTQLFIHHPLVGLGGELEKVKLCELLS